MDSQLDTLQDFLIEFDIKSYTEGPQLVWFLGPQATALLGKTALIGDWFSTKIAI